MWSDGFKEPYTIIISIIRSVIISGFYCIHIYIDLNNNLMVASNFSQSFWTSHWNCFLPVSNLALTAQIVLSSCQVSAKMPRSRMSFRFRSSAASFLICSSRCSRKISKDSTRCMPSPTPTFGSCRGRSRQKAKKSFRTTKWITRGVPKFADWKNYWTENREKNLIVGICLLEHTLFLNALHCA